MRILVIDDEEHLRDTLIQILARLDIEIAMAVDSVSAACALNEPFDLVFLDYGCCKSEGLMHKLSHYYHGNIVLISGYLYQDLCHYEKYVKAILTKPFSMSEIEKLINIIKGGPS